MRSSAFLCLASLPPHAPSTLVPVVDDHAPARLISNADETPLMSQDVV